MNYDIHIREDYACMCSLPPQDLVEPSTAAVKAFVLCLSTLTNLKKAFSTIPLSKKRPYEEFLCYLSFPEENENGNAHLACLVADHSLLCAGHH